MRLVPQVQGLRPPPRAGEHDTLAASSAAVAGLPRLQAWLTRVACVRQYCDNIVFTYQSTLADGFVTQVRALSCRRTR